MSLFPPLLLAQVQDSAQTLSDAEVEPFILISVLLSLVVIFLASKVGGELCARIDLPPVLGELVGGVVVGLSVLKLLAFPGEGGIGGEDSLLMSFLERTAGMPHEAISHVFASQGEIISTLSELGVILLLFEIGLESDLKELIRVGPQAAIVATVGVAVPFAAGTLGLIALLS